MGLMSCQISYKDRKKGKFVTKEGDEVVEGILIGGKNSKNSFVKSIKNTDEGIKEFKRLSKEIKKSADKTANIINKGVPRNPMFRKNYFSALEEQGIKLSENAKKFLAVHHIVPNFLKKNAKLHDLLKSLGHDIDEVINAIGLPRVDISLLDDTIKNLDEALQNAKNADEINELVDIINNIKAPLKLDDTVDIAKLKNILKELENFKTSAIHAVDSYHPKFNKVMEKKMDAILSQFDDFIIDGMSRTEALETIEPDVNKFISEVIDSLKNSKNKTLE